MFNLNLGQFELDKDIKKLSDQISKLSEKLDYLKLSSKEAMSQESKLLRDLNKCELEIDSLRSLKSSIENSMKDRVASQTDLKKSLVEAEKQMAIISTNSNELMAKIKTLQEEMTEIEKEAFAKFCKQIGVKSIKEYETKISGGEVDIFDRKCELEQLI